MDSPGFATCVAAPKELTLLALAGHLQDPKHHRAAATVATVTAATTRDRKDRARSGRLAWGKKVIAQ